MDLSEENRKRAEFRQILQDLANSQEVLRDGKARVSFYRRLEDFYHLSTKDGHYRHFYSDIFPLLTQIFRGESSGSIDVLGENLRMIREGYQPINKDAEGNPIDIQSNLLKLYDHVNLEIARINYTNNFIRQAVNTEQVDELQNKVKTLIKDTENRQTEFNEKVAEFNSEIKDTQEKLDKSERDYIAILGIFSSVVLTFTAGIAFSTSVLNNISQVSIYRLIGTALVIGLVLINILFVMFHFTGKLVKNDAPLKPFYISNGIFIAVLVAVIIAWGFGWVEKRNSYIDKECMPSSSLASVSSSSIENIETEINQQQDK